MSSDTTDPINNGAILNIAQLIKALMSSAAKAELGALYINTQEAVPMHNVLKEMGHLQPPTQRKPTTAWHSGLSPPTFNLEEPKQWT